MSQVLYRKYRPQFFADIAGQEQVAAVLKQTVKSDSPAHAYLFNGPRGTGKTSTARILAKALNCQKNTKEGDACGKCDICKAVEAGRFLDLIEVDAASNRGINEIRELKEKVAFSPVQGKYKVYIIDEVHMLTKEAFNALLKTLEEPPQATIFILATTEVHKLPNTILSRVVRFDFQLGRVEQLQQKLGKIIAAEKLKISEDALERLIKMGKGSYRDTESLLEKIIKSVADKNKEVTAEDVAEILGLVLVDELEALLAIFADSGEPDKVITAINNVEQRGVSAQQLLLDLAEYVITDIEQGSNRIQIRLALQMSAAIQELISQLNLYPDPYTAIKLRFVSLAGVGMDNSVAAQAAPTAPGRPATPTKLMAKPAKPETATTKSTAKPAAAKQDAKPVSKQVINPDTKSTTKSSPQHIVGDSDRDITSELLGLVKGDNPRIAAMIAQGNVFVTANTVLVSMPYKFHLDRLSDLKSKQLLAEKLKLLGVQFESIQYQIAAQIQAKPGGNAQVNAADPSQESEKTNEKVVEELFSDII